MKNLKWILPIAITVSLLGSCTHRSASETDTLRALKTINESIERSNSMIDDKNRKMTLCIQAERKFQPEKVDEALSILNRIRIKSTDIDTYIKGLIAELNKSESDGDISAVNRILANGKDGEVLFNKLQAYNKSIDTLMSYYLLPYKTPIDLIPPPISEENSGKKISWQFDFFHNTPKIGAITILNKFKNDVKNTEAMCIDRLAKEVVSTNH